jgi:hypothetical protein
MRPDTANTPGRVGLVRSEGHFLPRFAGSTTHSAFPVAQPPGVVREVRLPRVWLTSDLLEHGYHIPNVVVPRRGAGQSLDPSDVRVRSRVSRSQATS